MVLVPRVVDLIRANGQENVLVYVGGIIPDEDVPVLRSAGVKEVYGPGSSTETMAADIKAAILNEIAYA